MVAGRQKAKKWGFKGFCQKCETKLSTLESSLASWFKEQSDDKALQDKVLFWAIVSIVYKVAILHAVDVDNQYLGMLKILRKMFYFENFPNKLPPSVVLGLWSAKIAEQEDALEWEGCGAVIKGNNFPSRVWKDPNTDDHICIVRIGSLYASLAAGSSTVIQPFRCCIGPRYTTMCLKPSYPRRILKLSNISISSRSQQLPF